MEKRARDLGAAASSAPSSVPADAADRLRALGYVSGAAQPVSDSAPNPANHIAAWNTFERELTRLNAGDVARRAAEPGRARARAIPTPRSSRRRTHAR